MRKPLSHRACVAIGAIGAVLALLAFVPYWMVDVGDPPLQIALLASFTGYTVGVYLTALMVRL